MRSGLVAEFDAPDAFERAFVHLQELGYTRVESWSPYPVRGVVTRLPGSIVPWIMLAAGVTGAALAYFVEWWCNAYDYRLDVGGRPYDSIPAFIPIAFESGVLFAALSGFVAILGLSGLPRLHHAMFEVDGFERVAVDRFWIGVDAADPRFHDGPEKGLDDGLREVLASLGALRCERVGGAA